MDLSGTVRDWTGQRVSGARVAALGAGWETVQTGTTDAAGQFYLEGEGIIAVDVEGPDWQGPACQIRTLPRRFRIPGCPRPQSFAVDLALRRGFPVAVRAFAQDRLLEDIKPSGPPAIGDCWFVDLDNKVVPGGFRWRAGDGCPWLVLPPDEAIRLLVLWRVPGFGALVCQADNAGVGLRLGEQPTGVCVGQDGTYELWLNEDLARTACRRLEGVWARYQGEGYRFGADVIAQRERALAALQAMESVTLPSAAAGDSLPARRERARRADEALANALWALEHMVLQRAEQDIQRHRNRPRTLTVRLPGGMPAAGARVRFQQTEHDFRFGVFVNPSTHPVSREPLDGQLWTAIKDLGINQVTISMLWSHHEPRRGQREYREWDVDYPVAALHAAGFRLKSHVSVWFWHGYYPRQWGVFMPAWVYDLDAPEVLRAVYQHQRALVERYREHVAGFQAINEPMLSHTNGPNLSLRETIEAVRQSAQAIRDGGSEGPIEVNNCCVFAETVNADVREQDYERMPCEFFEDLVAAGVDFDEVGIQLYYGGYMCSDLFSGGFAVRHLLDLSELIDRYSLVGRPVNVSELSVPSSPPPENGPYVGEWHGPWSPERQAAWVKALYTLCYSKVCVQEVTWWNATDEGAFIHSGGLMTRTYQPKPAYHALRSLINGWKAAGETDCDPAGRAHLRGPAGSYQVTIDYEGEQHGPFMVHWGPDDVEAEVTVWRGPTS